jgi:Ca2+-binding EF-hand superfamily protein
MRTGIMAICVALAASLATTSKAGTGTVVRTFGDGELPAILAVYDLNGDGVLSQEEREAMRAGRDDRHQQGMKEWDTNGDGVISEEERAAAKEALQHRKEVGRENRFDEADTDGDGFLSFEEFSAIPSVVRLAQEHPDAPKAIFDGLDTNDDNLVSAEEFSLQLRWHDRPPLAEQFRVADTNADGFLSFAEFSAMPAMVALAKLRPDGPRQVFDKMDTDADSLLSLQEFLAQPPCPVQQPPKDPFAAADTDGDGFLSFAEFSAIPAMVDLAKILPTGPQQVFDRLDADDDNLLSAKEFLLLPPPGHGDDGHH